MGVITKGSMPAIYTCSELQTLLRTECLVKASARSAESARMQKCRSAASVKSSASASSADVRVCRSADVQMCTRLMRFHNESACLYRRHPYDLLASWRPLSINICRPYSPAPTRETTSELSATLLLTLVRCVVNGLRRLFKVLC
jgi:hypothetical protein